MGSTEEEGTALGTEETPEGETTEEAAPSAYYGAPEGDYEEFVLPDGFAADQALRDEFIPFAKELGLNQAGAQKLVDYKAKLDQQAVKNWHGHVKELGEQAKAHPEIGGDKYQPALAASRQVISKFGTPGLRKVMNDYGVGNHPEMILFMSRIGRAMGETPAVESGAPAGGQPKALHDILYKD